MLARKTAIWNIDAMLLAVQSMGRGVERGCANPNTEVRLAISSGVFLLRTPLGTLAFELNGAPTHSAVNTNFTSHFHQERRDA